MLCLRSIILIAFLGFVSCDIECYMEKLNECFEKSRNKDAEGFCELEAASVLCAKEAAEACKTGFEEEARKYLSLLKESCTEGTKLNIAIKGDEKCGVEKDMGTDHCSKGLDEDMEKHGRDFVTISKIRCKWLDSVSECVNKVYEKQCTKEFQEARRSLGDSVSALLKKICSVLPANQKRAIPTTNMYRSPFLTLL